MKNNIYKRILCVALSALSLLSCDYLDVSDELGGISSFENIFNNVDRKKNGMGRFLLRGQTIQIFGLLQVRCEIHGPAMRTRFSRENTLNMVNTATGILRSDITTDGPDFMLPSDKRISFLKWHILWLARAVLTL